MRNIDSLKKREDFQRIYRLRDVKSDDKLILYKAPGTGRIGIVCSKKVGNSVVRHRFRRIIREVYRLRKDEIAKNEDIIVVAKENAREQGFTELEMSFLHLLKRHSLILSKEESKQ